MREFLFSIFFVFFVKTTFAQISQDTITKMPISSEPIVGESLQSKIIDPRPPFNRKKKRIAIYAQTGIVVSTLATLNWAWYAKEPRQSISSFDDSKEWLQMDKIGHGFSTYSEAKLSTALWKYGGYSHTKSVLYGTSMAWLYQMSFEIMDGTVATYGFSWTDVAANTIGAGLFAFQELHWKQQRIIPKLSFWRPKYDASVRERVNNLYGTNGLQHFLKDYNGQIQWLSANLKSFFPKSKLPNWLEVSVGYSGDGMLGGFENKWKDANGNTIVRNDIARKRQWYVAPDINWSKFHTNNKFVKALFFVLSSVKFPTPGLELSGGKLKVKGIIF